MIAGIVTAMLLLTFLVGTVWAYSPKRKQEFAAAALLALDDAPERETRPASRDRG